MNREKKQNQTGPLFLRKTDRENKMAADTKSRGDKGMKSGMMIHVWSNYGGRSQFL